jgi:anaerobic magnesium-protoporphyrin IX monomethyl ester cyclase
MNYKHALCVYPHMEGAPEKKYFPPIGLEYIATALEGLMETVTLIDMRFEPRVGDHLKNNNIDLICLSVNWDYQRQAALDFIARIPSHMMVVIGGRYASTHVEDFFAATTRIDIIVRGDGEEIIRDIASGLPLKVITGISYREGINIFHNNVRDLRVLNESFYPNRKLRRVDYRLLFKNIDLGQKVDFISTSRGCPHNCKFCTFTNNPLGQKRNWSCRSAASVIEELKTIDANFIFVVDDNFAASMKRVEEICDLIIAERIKKTFAVALRLEIYEYPKILEKMFKAGFKILTIGIESAQDKTLNAMQKGFDTALAEKAFSEITKIAFYIHGYFIVGCIGESDAEMLEIASFAKRLKLATIDLSLLRTEKYSPLNEVIAKSKGYHVGEDNLVFSEKYSLKILGEIRHQIYRSYYDFSTVLRITKKVITTRLISFRYFLKLIFIFIFRTIFSKRKKN